MSTTEDMFDDLESSLAEEREEDFETTYWVSWGQKNKDKKLHGIYEGKIENVGKYDSTAYKVRAGKGVKLYADPDDLEGHDPRNVDLEGKLVAFYEKDLATKGLERNNAKPGDAVLFHYKGEGQDGRTKLIDVKVNKEERDEAFDMVEEAAGVADEGAVNQETNEQDETNELTEEEVRSKLKEMTTEVFPMAKEDKWEEFLEMEFDLEVVPENFKELFRKIKDKQ